ncbi:MAG: TonB family protein [Candidatus Kariarchaeaceae archaeon]|jgi:TonB family protein
MIKSTFTILLLFSIQLTHGQVEELEGFEIIWKGPLKVNQDYTREIFNGVAGHFTVKDYYSDGVYQMIGDYQSFDPEIEDGDFLFFHSNGQISHKGCYKNGELVGDWSIYNRDGELIDKINYDFDINETNKPSHETGEIDVVAEFAGIDLTAYLTSEIVYPPRAYKYYVQGKVHVQFMINVDGSISNALVVRGLDKDLDKEALRIIRNMPDWKTARKDGEPVPMSYTCPVVFTIKD